MGRSPGEGNGNPLQYSCPENPRDRAAWWDTVLGITKSQTCPSTNTTPVVKPLCSHCREHNQNQNQTNKRCRAWVGSVLSKFKGSFCRNPRRHTAALRSPSLFQGPEVAEPRLSIQKGSEVKVTHFCLTLCDPMDYTVHEIPQARILEWVVIPFSRGSSQPKSNPDLMHCRWILYQLSHKKEILMVLPMFPLHANSLSTLHRHRWNHLIWLLTPNINRHSLHVWLTYWRNTQRMTP